MDNLPPELISSIVSILRLDPASLLSVCLTSKRFLVDGRRSLYRNIAVAAKTSVVPFGCILLSQLHGDKLLATFTEFNPSLAQYVHTFTFAAQLLSHSCPRLARLVISLECMVNLKDFAFFSSFDCLPGPLNEVLKQCSFQLESFQTRDSRSSILREYILNQPQLKRLKLRWPKNTPFPNDCCPNLEILAGNSDTINAIFPITRSVTHLILTHVNPAKEPINITPIVSHRLGNLHTLCVRSWRFGSGIDILLPHLANLQVFHFASMDPMPDRTELDLLVTYVSHLPNLRVFIRSTQNTFRLWHDDPDALKAFRYSKYMDPPDSNTVMNIQNWFKTLPRFQSAYFQVSNTFQNERSFLVWERDQTTPVMVDGAEVWNISPWN